MDPRERERRLNQLAVSLLMTSLIALQAAAAVAAQAPYPVLISVPETYEVASATQEVVRLGDFAEIVSTEPALSAQLRALEIINAPETGKEVRIARSTILRMARIAGLPYGRLRFEGPSIVPVLGPGQDLSRESILEELKRCILEDEEWTEEELSLSPVSIPESIRLPQGDYELSLYRTGNQALGSVRYQLTVLIDHMEVARRPLIVEIGHLRPVWVVNKQLNAGEVVTEDGLRLERRRVLNERADEMSIEDLSELAGLKLSRTLARGLVLTRDVFAKELLVRRGDELRLFVHNGGIRLQVQAKAQSGGGPGDVINVKNLKNGKVVRARIINRTTVELI